MLDMRLPDGDGLDLLAEIRARELPIATVLLTGAGDEDTVMQALKLQADDYLIKQADYMNKLPSTLRAARERFERERALKSRIAQGYLFSRPLEATSAALWLADNSCGVREEGWKEI